MACAAKIMINKGKLGYWVRIEVYIPRMVIRFLVHIQYTYNILDGTLRQHHLSTLSSLLDIKEKVVKSYTYK